MAQSELEVFKNKILFKEIHITERSDDFSNLCKDAVFLVRHKIPKDGTGGPGYESYMSFLKLASGIIRRQMLIALCEDLKRRTDWKSLHNIWNEGDDNRYEEYFKAEIDEAKLIMKKLRPFILEFTSTWSKERKQADLDKPEGRFMKGWYLEGKLPTIKFKM